MTLAGLRLRVVILAAVLGLAFVGVTARLAHLQLVRHAELSALAERQHARTVALPAPRGPIVDRHGAVLATSADGRSLYAQPRHVEDPTRLAAQLARILDVPRRELAAQLSSPRPFVWLKRRLPPSVAAKAVALGDPGLGLVAEPLRVYPNRELAAHVLGFEGVDSGLEGLERAWDDILAGTPGRAVVGRDALGRDVETERVLDRPVPGRGLALTLDASIQYVAERELDRAWRQTGAKAATVVVMDPRTGDILALGLRPTFNPNAFLDVPSREHWRNRAITDAFEPGSTFKVVLAAAALEEGIVRPDDLIFAEHGAIRVARTTIHDWKPYGWLTFAEVLERSSNVGAIKVGLALGPERYHRYMRGFGFGAPTGVELQGESRGLLREPGRWSALSLPTLSIGQEVSVTALQLATAFGAIANGGALMRPRLVRAIVDAEGREVRRFEPAVVRRVITPETARTLTRLLVRVVEDGTGRLAAIAGYAVAGKTGTAQKHDPEARRYSRAPGVLSFAGWAPASQPRFVMLVLLDEPKTVEWGSEAAAPVFATIGREILRYLEVPPADAPPVQIVRGPGAETGPRVRLARSGEGVPPTLRLMPDLRGQSLRPALGALAALGLSVEITGRGVIVNQTPEAGAPLGPGTIARLALRPPALVR